MAELIDRQAAINAVTAIEPLGDFAEIDGREVLDCLRELPAADVRENVKGKWLRGEAYPHRIYCSQCYKTFIRNDEWTAWRDGDMPRNYCPNCGADMREEKQNAYY